MCFSFASPVLLRQELDGPDLGLGEHHRARFRGLRRLRWRGRRRSGHRTGESENG